MLKIGEFSKLSRVSIRMLRYYDEMGLLKPIETDAVTGYRYYSEKQLTIAGRITAFKDMGFGLSAIRKILDNYDDKDVLEYYLCLKREELMEVSEQNTFKIRLLETAIERLRKDDMNMKIEVKRKTLPKRYAATICKEVKDYGCEGQLWATLMKETAKMNLKTDSSCYCCTTYHENPNDNGNVIIEVQKMVSEKGDYADTENVTFKELPEVEVAYAELEGSYVKIGEILKELNQWVKDNGYESDSSPLIIYPGNTGDTFDRNSFKAEVCYPIKDK